MHQPTLVVNALTSVCPPRLSIRRWYWSPLPIDVRVSTIPGC